MGLFGKSKKEREKEYMNRLDVPLCLKEDFELIIDDVFTIMGVGTVATGNISTGMCREGENACVYKTNGGVLETIITTIDKIKVLLVEPEKYPKEIVIDDSLEAMQEVVGGDIEEYMPYDDDVAIICNEEGRY